jgi:hypothetical protein
LLLPNVGTWCRRRNDVKKTLITLAKEAGKGGDAEGAAGKVSDGNEADDEEDEEAKLLRQMEELNAKMARQKRSKKKAAQKLVRGKIPTAEDQQWYLSCCWVCSRVAAGCALAIS